MIQDPVSTQLYLSAPCPDALDYTVLSAALSEGVACLMTDISGFIEAGAEALQQMFAIADAAGCPLVAGGDDILAITLAKRFDLDGVHLTTNPETVTYARKQLGDDAIIGYGAGTSQRNALLAAENGADYVMFGPLEELEQDLLVWWQAVIETPLVVGCGENIQNVKGIADFAMVSQVFTRADPAAFVRTLNAQLSP